METQKTSTTCSTSLVCAQCGEEFPNMNQLKIHLRIHQGREIHACKRCGRNFLNTYQLTKHERSHTRDDARSSRESNVQGDQSSVIWDLMKTNAGKGQYKCEECGKSYTTRFYLKEHVVVHTGEKPFKCDQCGRDFATSTKLKSHTMQAHKEKPFKCSECDESFNVKVLLEKHRTVHTGVKPFKCDQCDEAFLSKIELSRHASRHSKPFTCKDCGSGFFLSTSLKLHLENLNNEGPCICDQCGKHFQSKECFQNHKCSTTDSKIVSSEKCEEEQNGERFFKCDSNDQQGFGEAGCQETSEENDETKDKNEKESFRCLECGADFETSAAHADHMKTHRSKSSFWCDLCDISFSRETDLQKHDIIHTGTKPYMCKACGKGFTVSSSFTAHMKKHSKPFTCEDCGCGFFESYSLKLHLRNLADEGPYSCQRCDKPFKSKECFQKHTCRPKEKKVSGKDPPPPVPKPQEVVPVKPRSFKCDHCGKVFQYKHFFQRHERLHIKPYICKYCGKRFKKPGVLTIHERTHTGERPFVCFKCGKGFISNYALKTHMVVHIVDRPFEDFKRSKSLEHQIGAFKEHESVKSFTCKHCGKRFKSLVNLTTHSRFHATSRLFSYQKCGKSRSQRGKFTCDRCGEAFSRRKEFESHKCVKALERKRTEDIELKRRSQQSQTNVLPHAVEGECEQMIKVKQEPEEEPEYKIIKVNDNDLKEEQFEEEILEQFQLNIVKVEDEHQLPIDKSVEVKEEPDEGERIL